MAHVAHAARLDQPIKDASTGRQSLTFLLTKARKQHGEDSPQVDALLEKLNGPPMPACLAYLEDWSRALFGRSGEGMGGAAPLSPLVVESWARMSGYVIAPHELDALLVLDGVRRNPPKEETR